MAILSIIVSGSSSAKFWTVVAIGIAVHNAMFIRGEWHVKAPQVLSAHILILFFILGFQIYVQPKAIANACLDTFCICFTYLGAILASIFTYRTIFHRLGGFPGPPLARISKLWHVYHTREGRNHLFLEDIRKKYGDFVRTGTLFHPGPQSLFNFLD